MNLRLQLKGVLKQQQAACIDIALPHIFERQQCIMKAFKPGDYYCMWDGGIAYNFNNCILVIEMKCIKNKNKALEKRKKSKKKRKKEISAAKDIIKERENL